MSRNFLPSGSVLPSGVLEVGTDAASGFKKAYENFDLKVGNIIAVYDKDHEKNISKAVREYDVAVVEQLRDLGKTISTYHNCVSKDIFGGIADYFEVSYRVKTTTNQGKSEGKDLNIQDGSTVLLLCLNGLDDSPIIIGGFPHYLKDGKLTKDSGHAMIGEFNGAEFSVDKDGAIKFTFKGATDIKGAPLKSEVSGSIIEINKDGSLVFTDGKKQVIFIDKKKKKIFIESEKGIELKTDGDFKLEAKKKAEIKASSSMLLESEGGVKMNGASIDIKSDGAFKAEASSVSIKSFGEVTIKGSQVTIGENVFLGGAGGSPAIIMTTKFLGTDSEGGPVVSNAIGPFSSKVFISS
jgi:hypothetical protein